MICSVILMLFIILWLVYFMLIYGKLIKLNKCIDNAFFEIKFILNKKVYFLKEFIDNNKLDIDQLEFSNIDIDNFNELNILNVNNFINDKYNNMILLGANDVDYLKKNIDSLEQRILKAIECYNSIVNIYNKKISKFYIKIIAYILGYKKMEIIK